MRDQRSRQRLSPWWGVGSEQVRDPRDARGEPDRPETDIGPAPEDEEQAAPSPALVAALEERDRYFDQLQRTTADYANYRRRTEQERAQQRLTANELLLRDILPVLDDLQRGLDAIPDEERHETLAEGMRLVEQKLLATLKRHGVTPIESLGQPFDPTVHEAIEADPSGGDTVVAVYVPGYRLGDGVLRPTMVKVGTADG